MIQIEINEDLKKKFEDDGYLILPQFLDTNKITSIADKFANLFSGIFETGIEPDEWNWKKEETPITLRDKSVTVGSQIAI